MLIRDMFAEDINRKINGVIKIDQDKTDVIEQEVREYVITKELKRHFISFFDVYCHSFDVPTADVGVWISGFYGSGKSHFLKMLSYILENKVINGISTLERFKQKFEDDPDTFRMIEQSTRSKTETILFNIDIEDTTDIDRNSHEKDNKAVLRVFAKMFYDHFGYFGDDLKVALLEQYIDRKGKKEEFYRVFEKNSGSSWIEERKYFDFNDSAVISTLVEVLGMSEENANNWFNGNSSAGYSIARLVDDIKAYLKTQPEDFRLLFMVDEVGQYIGTDNNMLLNLQSLIEKIGSECGGKVWIVCTGQEAIDEIIKVRTNEFSKIQARFKTRLTLSSASVDEVIQKRILKKNSEAAEELKNLYNNKNESVLNNLFTFDNAVLDIKGYENAEDFVVNFPFVPYQFIVLQKVFVEIRKHGNAGKHLSDGERSMLSGFQEAAMKIQTQDQNALVPFFRFYDTIHTVLDSKIRRVIEHCQEAADKLDDIEPQDVDILKLLYLIRYIDDIPANVENIVILMIEDINTDKILLRERVKESLNRLLRRNFIGKSGSIYNFLTNEEQDIQREIKNTVVDTAAIIKKISEIIFGDIYKTTNNKFHYDKYDFEFAKEVDDTSFGNSTGGMKLRFLTFATDPVDKTDLHLMGISKGQAIVVLPESPYYENIENSTKINKYIEHKTKSNSQQPKSVQDIIENHRISAKKYLQEATEQLKSAIVNSSFYVDGEKINPNGNDAKSKINHALDYLVSHVYKYLDLIEKNVGTDADITEILTGTDGILPGIEPPNSKAVEKMEEYLDFQDKKNIKPTMADIQNRYKNIPYGWREIDIAAITARLIQQQKVTVKYEGETIQPNNSELPDMLRKKSEIEKTVISKRHIVAKEKINTATKILSEYFDVMDIPKDEDGFVTFIIQKFTEQKQNYEALDNRYDTTYKYPYRDKVRQAIQLMTDILSQKLDNTALINRIIDKEDDLLDSKEDIQIVEGFFHNQSQIFDAATKLVDDLRNDTIHLSQDSEAEKAYNKIKITVTSTQNFNNKKIPELNDLIKTVQEGYNRLLDNKRKDILDVVTQCLAAIRQTADGDPKVKDIVQRADNFYASKKDTIAEYKSITLLDGLVPQLTQAMDKFNTDIKAILNPFVIESPTEKSVNLPKKNIKQCYRQILFQTKMLENEAAIDEYVEHVREDLKNLLQDCDGIQIK